VATRALEPRRAIWREGVSFGMRKEEIYRAREIYCLVLCKRKDLVFVLEQYD